MMQYSMTAMVKAMKIQEIILKATSGQILWIEAADMIGISYRSMKRWKTKYEKHGYDGLWDRRMKSPSPKRVPLEELQTILKLYREKYMGFNATHFHEKLQAHHVVTRGYTFIKNALQTAGLLDKGRARGKHRKKRPRRSLVGMMLHLDGSPHEWIPDLPGQFFDLLVLMDDASNEIYDLILVQEENLIECMKLIRDCIQKHGLFCSLYTDRAPQFFFTPKGAKTPLQGHLTQLARALNECGIRMIPSFCPQGRGRGERMNETLQGRLPNEFKLHGIKTLEAANRFLKEVYIKEHNKRFRIKPEQEGTAFVPVPPHINLELIFSIKEERTVNSDNTVSFEKLDRKS